MQFLYSHEILYFQYFYKIKSESKKNKKKKKIESYVIQRKEKIVKTTRTKV